MKVCVASPRDLCVGKVKPRTVRVLTGFRGLGKTTQLRRELSEGESKTLQARTVFVDFEASACQCIYTVEKMLAYILEQAGDGSFRLVLDEPAQFQKLIPLIDGIWKIRRCKALFLIMSNGWRLEELEQNFPLMHCHLLDGQMEVVPPERMKLTYHATILYDMMQPGRTLDVFASRHVGSWLVDHLGEATSTRKLAAAISQYGEKVSHPTADAYLTALQNAFLVERVFCWDLFDNEMSRSGFKIAVLTPGLFDHVFASNIFHGNSAGTVWNRCYRTLRRDHDLVCYPICGHADFVTFEEGRPVCWMISPNGTPVLRDK